MPLKDWSTTAASNTSAPPNGAPEGMTIANVNNVIRQVMADTRTLAAEDTIASATTCDLGTKDATFLTVSGTTTITGFGTVSAGIYKFVKFSGALTLTHNATSLILLTGANRTTVAGDCGLYKSEGSGNWREYFYSKQTDYQPLDAQLTTLAALAYTDGNFIVGNGSEWVAESGATARESLGLPALLNQNYGSDGVTKITTNTTVGADFNTHTSAGVYNFDAASSANAPVTGLSFIFLEVFRHSNLAAGSEYTVQIAHDMNAGTRPRSWTRRQVAGSWSAWVETTSGAQSLAASGYKTLPGGLIIQWVVGTAAASGTSQTITFPIAFPASVYRVFATAETASVAGNSTGVQIRAQSFTTTSVSVDLVNTLGTANANTVVPVVFAVGI